MSPNSTSPYILIFYTYVGSVLLYSVLNVRSSQTSYEEGMTHLCKDTVSRRSSSKIVHFKYQFPLLEGFTHYIPALVRADMNAAMVTLTVHRAQRHTRRAGACLLS